MAGDPLAAAVTAPSILVLTVGGLGSSQMADIEARFRIEPRCRVVSAGKWDGYKTDLLDLIAHNQRPFVAVIGHSFSAIPILDLIANSPGLVSYAAFIDPVSDEAFVSSYPMPTQRPKFFWCQRSKIGIEAKLNITDAGQPEIIEGGHNELPHKTEVIERLARDILG